MKKLSSLRNEVAIRREILVPRKYGMEDLMLALKDVYIKAENISVHMHQRHTTTKLLKDKYETPTEVVNAGKTNETKTLCLPT